MKRILFNELDKLINLTVGRTEKVLLTQYVKSLAEIDRKISLIYDKYAKAGIITRSDLMKYGRLKALQDNIFKDIDDLSKFRNDEIHRLVEKVYTRTGKETFDTMIKELPKSSMMYIHPNRALILASINNPIDKLTLPQRLAEHTINLKSEIRNQITQGLIQGESYYKMGERIRGSLEGDLNKSILVARTEAHRNQNAARQNSYSQLSGQGIYNIQKEWLSTKGKRTRDSHIRLNGQRVPTDGYFEIDGKKTQYPGGFGIASEDVNCRCTTIITIDN